MCIARNEEDFFLFFLFYRKYFTYILFFNTMVMVPMHLFHSCNWSYIPIYFSQKKYKKICIGLRVRSQSKWYYDYLRNWVFFLNWTVFPMNRVYMCTMKRIDLNFHFFSPFNWVSRWNESPFFSLEFFISLRKYYLAVWGGPFFDLQDLKYF